MLVILTSHWKEDLDWLKKSKFPVVLIDKEGSDPSCFEPAFVIPNKGGVESVFCKYVIENYDNLPDNLAVIHGHENAFHHHHDRPLLEVIESANLSHGYIPLNGGVRFYPFYNEVGTLDAPQMWDDLHLPQNEKPEIGSLMICQPNSQFIVTRDRIRRHPKELYEHMLDVLMTEEPTWCEAAKCNIYPHHCSFENIFHIFFGEKQQFFYNPDWFNFKHTPKVWCGHPKDEQYEHFEEFLQRLT
jgi:hypothetical protein